MTSFSDSNSSGVHRSDLERQSEVIDQLNQQLADMQKRIRTILTSLPLGLLMIGEGTKIGACNAQVCEIFGYEREELADQPLKILFPELDVLEVTPRAFRVAARRKGGEGIACEIFVNEIEQGNDRRVFVHVQDVSERQRLEQLRRDFVAMVSHDLRTPLTSIAMSLDMIQSGTCGPITDTAQTVIAQAQSSSNFLVSLVTELLDSEKLQSNEFELTLHPTKVKSVIDKSIHATEAVAKQAAVKVETDYTNDVFVADEDRIAQVLINLIGNAIKYSPRDSKVIVRAGLEGASVKFRVSDNGPGIPAALQAAVFEPYRQLQQPKATKRRGFGLGLAICKQLVELHHGSISVTSVEGKGSTFEFSIPLVDEPD